MLFWLYSRSKLRAELWSGCWRSSKRITIDNALAVGWYQSHTDIVMEVKNKFALIVGGNVSHSVTMREVRVNAQGRLTDTQNNWFVVMDLQG